MTPAERPSWSRWAVAYLQSSKVLIHFLIDQYFKSILEYWLYLNIMLASKKKRNGISRNIVGEGSLVIKDPFPNEDEKTREIGTQNRVYWNTYTRWYKIHDGGSATKPGITQSSVLISYGTWSSSLSQDRKWNDETARCSSRRTMKGEHSRGNGT